MAMPKDLAEFEELEDIEGKAGGKKVDWDKVVEDIVATGEAYTVKEVWEKFAEKKVGQFRTKNALDKKAEEGKLRRKWDGKRFWYGSPS